MTKIDQIRVEVARLGVSLGCGCCEDTEERELAESRLAELLNIPLEVDSKGIVQRTPGYADYKKIVNESCGSSKP